MTWAPPQDKDEMAAAEESDGVRRSWGKVSSSRRPVPSCPSVPAPQLHISCSQSSSINWSTIRDQYFHYRIRSYINLGLSFFFFLNNLLRFGFSPEERGVSDRGQYERKRRTFLRLGTRDFGTEFYYMCVRGLELCEMKTMQIAGIAGNTKFKKYHFTLPFGGNISIFLKLSSTSLLITSFKCSSIPCFCHFP